MTPIKCKINVPEFGSFEGIWVAIDSDGHNPYAIVILEESMVVKSVKIEYVIVDKDAYDNLVL